MPAPNKPNTEAARAALAAKRAAARAEKEFATAVALFGDADALALMISLMRKRRDKIESDLESLASQHAEACKWLAEHDPASKGAPAVTTKPKIDRWYRSTIDPEVNGKVVAIHGDIVRVRLSGTNVIDECHGGEFAESWEDGADRT